MADTEQYRQLAIECLDKSSMAPSPTLKALLLRSLAVPPLRFSRDNGNEDSLASNHPVLTHPLIAGVANHIGIRLLEPALSKGFQTAIEFLYETADC